MPKVALAFFTVAVVYVLIGMGGGIYMGASGDHSLAPVHAHLNLIGFMMMSVMGTFYALSRTVVEPGKIAWANFWVLNVSLVIMIPTLAVVVKGNEAVAPILALSEVGSVIGVILFLTSVLRLWRVKA